MTSAVSLAEQKLLPDFIVRYGIRQLLKQRLLDECANDVEQQNARQQKLLAYLRQSPIAIETDAANEQHYEVPAAFYQLALGKHLKYSSCYWEDATETLDKAEVLMLALTSARADLLDGQHILELGCGWGSLTLWMAEHFPHSNIHPATSQTWWVYEH
jgi:cyclopropane-fatty-acyl-phospholipid synthase